MISPQQHSQQNIYQVEPSFHDGAYTAPQPVGSPPPTYVTPQILQGSFGQQPQPVGTAQPAPSTVNGGYYATDAQGEVIYMAALPPQQGVPPAQGQPMYVLSPQATGVDQNGQPIYTSYVAAPPPAMVNPGGNAKGVPVPPPQVVVVKKGGSSAGAVAAGGCCGACCGALTACCCCCTVM